MKIMIIALACAAIIFAQNNNNKSVSKPNYSVLPCKYIGIGRVIEANKDTNGRVCIFDNHRGNLSILTEWHYNEKNEVSDINPITITYRILYLCKNSTMIINGNVDKINEIFPQEVLMADTLDSSNMFKKIYLSHCDQ